MLRNFRVSRRKFRRGPTDGMSLKTTTDMIKLYFSQDVGRQVFVSRVVVENSGNNVNVLPPTATELNKGLGHIVHHKVRKNSTRRLLRSATSDAPLIVVVVRKSMTIKTLPV